MGARLSKGSIRDTTSNVGMEKDLRVDTVDNDTLEETESDKGTLDPLPTGHPKISASRNGGGCPMKKDNRNGSYIGNLFRSPKKEINQESHNESSTKQESGCPIKTKPLNEKGVQYNVYSQPIDPKNNMPAVANQLPSPLQNESLSTNRVQSNIPKGGGSDQTWTYPSPQMFYNSLARKNKLGDTQESEIESVVALHNNMNEKTWAKVMEWEAVLDPEGVAKGGSKLLKFLGRPSDLSPKAWFRNKLFGYPLPFDRHDWTVVRPDGTELRYVIDYYYDESRASDSENSGMPALNDRDAVKSILVDVRPAIDSVENAVDRGLKMPYARHFTKSTGFEPLSMFPTTELKQQIGESEKVWENIQNNVKRSKEKSMMLKKEQVLEEVDISDEEAVEVSKQFSTMLTECQSAQEIVAACSDEDECRKAALGLSMCLAKVVCPLQQSTVAKVLHEDDFDPQDEKAAAAYNAKFDKALENMAACVQAKGALAAKAKQSHPQLFEK